MFELVPIITQGDIDKTSPLSTIGGKGVFIKGLEQALLNNDIDIAVHSFKDITANLASGLTLAGCLEPESICDVLVLRDGLNSLRTDPLIYTGSLRRQLFLKALYPSATVLDIRGNLGSRLDKLDASDADAIMVSEVGLIRLKIDRRIIKMNPDTFYPAPGQGVIAFEIRDDDVDLYEGIQLISHLETWKQIQCELVLLKQIGFDCGVPMGMRTHCYEECIRLFVAIGDAPLMLDFTISFDRYESDLLEASSRLVKALNG